MRHVRETLTDCSPTQIDERPFFVQQYFPDARPGYGHDPRKHAVAVCFAAEMPPTARPAQGSEAVALSWFSPTELPAELWPGTADVVHRCVESSAHRDEVLAAYGALSARQVSHDELMWQTPALAMTAMAFLLTIALGNGQAWQRALAAALSAGVALISAQLMAKHSAHAVAEAEALLAIERARRMPQVHARPGRTATRLKDGLQGWFATKRSRDWWFVSLLGFGAVSCVLVAEAVVSALRGL